MARRIADIIHPATFFDTVSPPVYVTCFTQSKGFLEFAANKFDWEVLDSPTFMDIGCGSPEYFLGEYVLARFPETINVVSIDNLRSYIFMNRIRPVQPDKRVVFFNGDIGLSGTVCYWFGKIDKILSMNCFQEVKDQAEAFRNVFRVLKPGGEAGISFCLRSGYAGWHFLLACNKWKTHCKVVGPILPVTQPCPPTEQYYSDMVVSLGFEVVFIWKENVEYVFPTDRQWKEKVLRQALKTFNIPDEELDEFKSDLYNLFELVNPRKNGLPCERTAYLMVLVRKPITSLF